MAKVTFDYSRTAQFISKEEVENSKVLAAVSYTHLDVYKRQVYIQGGSGKASAI